MFSFVFRIAFIIILSSIFSNVEAVSGELIQNKSSKNIVIQNIIPILPPLFTSKEDTDLAIFTSRYIWLSDKNYIPLDLVSIEDLSHIEEAGRKSKLRREAHDALWFLGKAFEDEFGIPLVVISGYRSAEYQKRMWDLSSVSR
jgi:hypothetical protein